jgi:YD repeat-containing protein
MTFELVGARCAGEGTAHAVLSDTYTSTGKYATSTDASGTTTYTYDNMDRLSSKATPEGTLNYTYDAAGHVAPIASSNTNGASTSYTYDDLNRLNTVVDNRLSGSNTTTYSYDSANNVATVSYPNGVQSTFTYDILNRVSMLVSPVSGYGYQRGPTGNLTSATELSGRTENWTYDGIYRLTNETISLAPSGKNGSIGYGLDPVGNRTSESSTVSGISSGSFGFNADDELTSESYDQNGNVTASGGKAFSYDSQNQLMSMTASGTSASMVYDAFGNRVSKTVNGVTTKYLVDDLNPTGYPQVVDELTNGTVTRAYTTQLPTQDFLSCMCFQVLTGNWQFQEPAVSC